MPYLLPLSFEKHAAANAKEVAIVAAGNLLGRVVFEPGKEEWVKFPWRVNESVQGKGAHMHIIIIEGQEVSRPKRPNDRLP